MMVTTLEKTYSFEDYCHYDDGTDNRYEWVRGHLELMAPPTGEHILIAKRLEKLLDQMIEQQQLPWLCSREVGVRTIDFKARIPDLIVITESQFAQIFRRSAICEEAPLLVIEIVSPESVKRDYRYKRSEYAAMEVPEYWIVDPEQSQVTVLTFNEGLYDETVFCGEQSLISRQFLALNVSVNQILTLGQ